MLVQLTANTTWNAL